MTINCNGRLLDLTTPKVMGILNITPDSFYDGGRYNNPASIVQQVERMLKEGASLIDIGAHSSKPGAKDVSEDVELHRVLPVVNLILNEFPHAVLSIDTFRSRVAKKCLQVGAAMINDISGGYLDHKMMATVAEFQVPFIAMHMRGTPQTMKSMTTYDDMLKEVLFYFSEIIAKARDLKINDLILDPGFGFAKTVEQNYRLLQHLDLFKNLERPILAGVSRKSMIYKTLGCTPEKALNGTTALHMAALERGANILRAHDVQEAMECIRLFQALESVKMA
ncbi:dihydropteroate synthase [Muricauda sp. SCSIO 64092]|uniref:dihydropteroate synthase n=1 Tax=Allomuricauda sp. SCSIO 64092 TaxID=2908842 RepID=UPI001FF36C22|nr:dihydropteroate synthase [Muricauda sp. SCSIO 64092]UOY05459.1 dihydropteroate synthase [Muricauda sp. SCSIO 64092]